MLYYYGADLLSRLYRYYGRRLQTAVERGFTEPGHQYYWLYQELKIRVKTIRQVHYVLLALPAFMKGAEEAELYRYVMDYTASFFTEAGEKEEYFSNDNLYWCQFQESVDRFDKDYDTALLPVTYVDVTECIVRALRMYFYVREHEHTAIDRQRFDDVMEARPAIAPAAERG